MSFFLLCILICSINFFIHGHKMSKITIAVTGYVVLSNILLLVQRDDVFALDNLTGKLAILREDREPIVDTEIETFLLRDDRELLINPPSQSF